MRKALGLLGAPSRQRPQPERTEAPARLPERVGSAGVHRRRFVQDGDVPVKVLRREPGQDPAATRTGSTLTASTSSRLQQLETALASETAARVQAERALAEAQAVLHDLQTKIGHADLARNEARAALEHEGEVVASLRHTLEAVSANAEAARLHAVDAERRIADYGGVIAEERQARRSLEQSLQAAIAARHEAEQRLHTLCRTMSEPVAQASHVDDPMPTSDPKANAVRKRGRAPAVRQPTLPQLEVEPEPVKWWLTSAKRPVAAAKSVKG